MKQLRFSTHRLANHFPNGSSGYSLENPGGWTRFTGSKNNGDFVLFHHESRTSDSVRKRLDPKLVTENEMEWMVGVTKKHGHSFQDLVKASDKDVEAFRLVAFLEVAHLQVSLLVERDTENRTFGFSIDHFLGELVKVQIPAKVS